MDKVTKGVVIRRGEERAERRKEREGEEGGGGEGGGEKGEDQRRTDSGMRGQFSRRKTREV